MEPLEAERTRAFASLLLRFVFLEVAGAAARLRRASALVRVVSLSLLLLFSDAMLLLLLLVGLLSAAVSVAPEEVAH